MKKIILTLGLIALLAVGCNQKTTTPLPTETNTDSLTDRKNTDTEATSETIQFSKFNSVYKFSAQISNSWKVEYVPSIESINIYDSNKPGSNNLEKSVIFIRYFNANSFLTLNTVNILSKTETDANGHKAVRYEIENKPGVANFPNQPLWRNKKHKLIDIRYSTANPSPFYVFAYNPELPTEQFEAFVDSLKFHNDVSSLQTPILKHNERVTKKPFGIKISPDNSPVQPERFSGFHNAVDYEIFPGEEKQPVKIMAVCGGNLISKKKAAGYGGVATQSCRINDEAVTVVYGHLELSSISALTNSYLAPGDFLGNLGEGASQDTDIERKHLHLGIKKSSIEDIRGYVSTEAELSNWIDFQKLGVN